MQAWLLGSLFADIRCLKKRFLKNTPYKIIVSSHTNIDDPAPYI